MIIHRKMIHFSKEQISILSRYISEYNEYRLLSVKLLRNGLMQLTEVDVFDEEHVFYEYYDRFGELVRSEFDDIKDFLKK